MDCAVVGGCCSVWSVLLLWGLALYGVCCGFRFFPFLEFAVALFASLAMTPLLIVPDKWFLFRGLHSCPSVPRSQVSVTSRPLE